MKLILFGPQGSGKGTAASFLTKEYGIPHISTGEIFRKNIEEKTELGNEVQKIVTSGELVPDELTFKAVENRLHEDDCQKGFILDGFPRNLKQANLLMDTFKIDSVIFINVPENISVERITNRRQCKNCGAIYNLKSLPPKTIGKCDICGGDLYQRKDDTEEAILKRLEIYRKETLPLHDFFKNITIEIDGTKAIDEVNKEIFQKLK